MSAVTELLEKLCVELQNTTELAQLIIAEKDLYDGGNETASWKNSEQLLTWLIQVIQLGTSIAQYLSTHIQQQDSNRTQTYFSDSE